MPLLDGTDTRLLLALAKDPRRTVVALAGILGISRNTIQARLAQLEKKAVFLPFERRISTTALGYPLMAFVHVHVRQRQLAAITEQLALVPEVVEAHGLTGDADILLRVVAADADDLFRVTKAILRHQPGHGRAHPVPGHPAAGAGRRRRLTCPDAGAIGTPNQRNRQATATDKGPRTQRAEPLVSGLESAPDGIALSGRRPFRRRRR
jgi:DNA-binding Lrp family transcriptional regulator